ELVVPEAEEASAQDDDVPSEEQGEVVEEPTATEEPTVAPSPTEAPATGGATISGDSYTVVAGDHLWSIAVRAYGDGYRWVDIARANNIANPNLIYPDQEFTLPR